MSAQKVLITDEVHQLLIDGLTSRGYQCRYMPDISYVDTMGIVKQFEGLVINSKIKAHDELLSEATKLKFIARLGSGLEIIDLPLAQKKGISIFSAPEGNCNAVAEHAMGMLLCLLNNLLWADEEVRNQVWNREKHRGRELSGCTVGIIGYGHTGPAFATKLQGFDVKVLVYDRFIPNLEVNRLYMETCSMERIQQEADIISIHTSLNPTSLHLVNTSFIQACKKPFILINTARGKAVHLPDLISALSSGKVAGACLDVFENEKPSTFDTEEKELYSQLYQMNQVVLSPHIAGWTYESKRRIAEVLLKKLDESGL